jgi:hypothetical protein
MLGFVPDNPESESKNTRKRSEGFTGFIFQELPSLSFKATKNHEWKCS